MLTQHKQTQLFKVTKLTQIKILPSIFTLKTVHPVTYTQISNNNIHQSQ